MEIKPFGVEQWMNRWETLAVNNIAETCVDSLFLYELLELSERKEEILVDLRGDQDDLRGHKGK
jgi:hypothetical protein